MENVNVYGASHGALILIPRGKASGAARPAAIKAVARGAQFTKDGFPAKTGTFSVAAIRAILAHYAERGAAQTPALTATAMIAADLAAGRLEVPTIERAARAGSADPFGRTVNVLNAWADTYADAITDALADAAEDAELDAADDAATLTDAATETPTDADAATDAETPTDADTDAQAPAQAATGRRR